MHAELKARGQRVARMRVARLMRQVCLRGRARRRFVRTTDSAHRHPGDRTAWERTFNPAPQGGGPGDGRENRPSIPLA
ncbi:hypothetical protein JYK02_27445 [Corallococcus macrosporus]|uniref:HTH-like domain-containing protein n=1 Tax=Corallococcus macrosporus TaxID=35 RepID=A0ABS3DIX2_9BACT|nr:hypothetical protein [Corallococcus macrosporus]